jgi:hypothetical protein
MCATLRARTYTTDTGERVMPRMVSMHKVPALDYLPPNLKGVDGSTPNFPIAHCNYPSLVEFDPLMPDEKRCTFQ